MHRYLIFIFFASYSLYAITNAEILAGYNQFEKKIAPKEDAKRHFSKTVNSRQDIPKFIKYQKNKGLNNISDYYFAFLTLPDFGRNVTMSNYFNSLEYKYVLKNIKPTCVAKGNKDSFYVATMYMDRKVFKYDFPIHCQYKRSTTKLKNLGFFEVVGTGGMAESKNVSYDVYSCSPRKSDVRKIKQFEKRLGTKEFSKVLAQAPWEKYVYTGKTYNKATYRPPVSSSSSENVNTSSSLNKSGSSRSSQSSNPQRGVKEVYYSGSKSADGYKIYRIKCTSGSSYTAFQKSDGYWYDTAFNYGSSYRNLSSGQFAEKKCK
jgi:hypothetical protein